MKPFVPKERDIEAYLVKRVKELGGEVRKVQWVGRAHAPDRFAMLPVGGRWFDWWSGGVWVELKRPGEKPRPGQLREHARMRRMGLRVEVIDSLAGVDQLLGE